MPASPDRETLIEQLKAVAARLGPETVTLRRFNALTGISRHQVHRHFDSFGELQRAAGLAAHAEWRRIPDEDLLRAMADVFRREGGVVPLLRFTKLSGRSATLLQRRWGGWAGALQAFRRWQTVNDPDFPYGKQVDGFRLRGLAPRRDRPPWTPNGGRQYGEALNFRGLLHTPVNEQGVIFLFATLAVDLGFLIESLTSEFPDCEAKRRVGKTWERVCIEFEFESRNFRSHRHDPEGCDLIVCWQHNWPECPLEVLELKQVVMGHAPPQVLPSPPAKAPRFASAEGGEGLGAGCRPGPNPR